MCDLAKSISVAAVCLVMAGSASAIDPRQPYVTIAMPRKPVSLGKVWGPGVKQVGAQMSARVMANIPYHLEASFQSLRHTGGKGAISPKHMSVSINGKRVAAGAGRVAIAHSGTPTPPSGVDVSIELQVGVKGLEFYPAGRYRGTLLIRVVPGS